MIGEISLNRIINVENFAKSYGEVKAVKGISFYVEEGKLFSFLGPNGAGKSTTIDALCTLMDFDSGKITINGYDLRKQAQAIRQSIGVVFQDSVLDDLLTVRENLFIRAGLYSRCKSEIKHMVDDVLKTIELSEFLNRPYGKLSGGQRRRSDIAAALLHRPIILFLDEPTTGLDPQTRLTVWDTIKKLQAESGMTVFLTTHYMEEATDSDYIIVIDHGDIAAKGTPQELKTKYSSDSLLIVPTDNEAAVLIQKKLTELKTEYSTNNGTIIVMLPDTIASISILESCKRYIASFQVLQGSMDDAFIGITGREIRR
jgi:multidrug/hemolysin transport system ATP-binding protein